MAELDVADFRCGGFYWHEDVVHTGLMLHDNG
jgi:hypothetical protein